MAKKQYFHHIKAKAINLDDFRMKGEGKSSILSYEANSMYNRTSTPSITKR